MNAPRIQSALTGPALRLLTWFGAKKPTGSTLPVPEPLGNFFQHIDTDLGVDLEGYYLRDAALAQRDLVVGKAIELVAKAVAEHVPLDLTGFGVALANLSTTAVTATATVAVGQTYLRSTISLPIQPGSLSVTVGDLTATDQSLNGVLRDSSGLLHGAVDYDSGLVELNFPAPTVELTAALVWRRLDLLANESTDLDAGHSGLALGGLSGVRHVGPGDSAESAVIADQHLYERDLILLWVIAEVDANLSALTGKPRLLGITPDPKLDLVDGWSQAEGSSEPARISFASRWSHLTFKAADQHLAWRDNVLARVAAELSRLLAYDIDRDSRRSAICAEKTGDAILAENAVTPAEQPAPSHWPTGSLTDAEARGILPEKDFFVIERSGHFQAIDHLHAVSVEVTDTDLADRLERSGARIAIAPAIGLAGANQTALADWVTRFGPEQLVLLGNSNLPDGASGTMAANTAVWNDLYAAGKVSAVVGPNDYSSGVNGTSLTAFLAKFGPDRSWTYVSDNGALELFAIDAGLNRTMAAAATSSNPGSLGAGNTADSAQALELQTRLAASTAVWKVVLVAVSPETRPILQWPFKEWGADAVVTIPDSGTTLKSSLSGVPLLGCNGSNYYFEVYATAKSLQFRLRGAQAQFNDSVSTWAQFYRNRWQASPYADLPETGALAQISRSADSGSPRSIAVQDWELVKSAVSGLPRLYLPALAPERFRRSAETARYVEFKPARAVNGRPLLTYDRLHRSLAYTPAHSGFAAVSADALTELTAHRDTTVVTVALKSPADSYLALRHKALRSNQSPCRDWTAYQLGPDYGALPGNSVSTPETDGLAVICTASEVTLTPFAVPDLRVTTAGQQWLRVVALLECALNFKMAVLSPTTTIGNTSSDSSGYMLDNPADTNLGSSPTNEPALTWAAPIVAAAYRLRIHWSAPDGPHDSRCTLRLSSRPIAALRFVSAAAVADQVTDWVTFVSTSVSPDIKLTRDRTSTTGSALKITAIEFELVEAPAASDLRMTCAVGSSALNQSVAGVYLDKPGTLLFSSKWVDLANLSAAELADLPITLNLANIGCHVTLRGLVAQVKTKIENSLVSDAKPIGYATELRRLLAQSWNSRQQVDADLTDRVWGASHYTAWLNSLAFADATLGCAFRAATTADLGRFCLVPRSLGAGMAVGADLQPELRVLDASLLQFGVVCADRCFDYCNLPSRSLVVITQDTVDNLARVWSSDQNLTGSSAGLLSTDFSQPDNSAMITLI